MKNSEDILWVTRVLLWNDEHAFKRLMEKYLPQVRRYFLVQTMGNQALSDDLTQETFIKAWQGIGGFCGLSSFSTWLYRIAFNTFMNHTRNATCQTTPIDNERTAYEIADESPQPLRQKEALQNAICQLNEKERHCITLFYLEEMSIKEIQKITGYPAGSIKAYLSRGRNNLEKILKSYEKER